VLSFVWVRAPWIASTAAPASSASVAPPARLSMFHTSSGIPEARAIRRNQRRYISARTGSPKLPLTTAPIRSACGTASSSGKSRMYFVRSKSAAERYFDFDVFMRQRQPAIFSQVKKPAHCSPSRSRCMSKPAYVSDGALGVIARSRGIAKLPHTGRSTRPSAAYALWM
jgi:hypothetical protein